MQNSRPSVVRVGPHTYTITSENGLSKTAGVTGVAGTETQTILIDSQLGDSVEQETVLHELLHAAWTQTLLDRKFSDEKEEDVIWTLAPRILALLKDNRSLVYWLLKGEADE